jgi:hypothetical protein
MLLARTAGVFALLALAAFLALLAAFAAFFLLLLAAAVLVLVALLTVLAALLALLALLTVLIALLTVLVVFHVEAPLSALERAAAGTPCNALVSRLSPAMRRSAHLLRQGEGPFSLDSARLNG